MNFPLIQQIKLFLKQTFVVGLVISLCVYGWVRLIFFEVPFSFVEDGSIVIKTILTGWTIIMLLNLVWIFLLQLAEKIRALATGR